MAFTRDGGGGFRGFGQCPKENVFLPLTPSLIIVMFIIVITTIIIIIVIIVLHPLGGGGWQGSPQIRVSHACWVEETLSNFTITRESKTFVSGKDTLCQPMLWVGTALIMGLKCKQIRNQF